MADERRRRQPLPPLPPPSHHQYSLNPPFDPAANQEPLPALPLPVATSPSSRTRSSRSATLVKRERVAHKRRSQQAPEEEDAPANEQPNRYYLIALIHAGVTVVIVGWSIYLLVRYSRAIRDHADDPQRQRYAIAFTALSVFALLIFAINLGRALRLPPRLHIVHQVVILLGSLSLLTPTLFNLAFVSLWHRRSPSGSTMSLVGQCHWDIDVVWGGRSGQCPESAAKWGGWLAGAIVRFVVTLLFLIACHWLTWLTGCDGRTHSSGQRQRSQSTASLMNSNKSRRSRQASHPTPFTASSASSSQLGHRRTFSSSNTAAQSPSSLTYIPHHLTRTPSSTTKSPTKGSDESTPPRPSGSSNSHGPSAARLSPTSDISDYYSDVDDGGDLNRFAVNFRTLVERVSRETEDGARLPAPIYNLTRPTMAATSGGRTTPPPRRSPSPRNSSSRRSSVSVPSSPPAHTAGTSTSYFDPSNSSDQLDAHAQMQHDLLQAHRLMLLEQAMRAESYEHVVVLGGAVRRMSTIASIADGSERDLQQPPWTPTSGASSVYMTPMELTRSPTSSTARSGRRNPMSRHTATPPPPQSVGAQLADSYHSDRGNYTD